MKGPKSGSKLVFLELVLILIAALFSAYFAVGIVPQLLIDRDVVGAFSAGFVNPYATGYSLDVIACWFFLLAWVVHERVTLKVQNGWIALILGIVPGVIVGLVAYTIIRRGQVRVSAAAELPKN